MPGEPPGGEQDRVGRGGIDPLEVVHHDEQRLRFGRRCEKAQRSRRYSLRTSCLGSECKRTSKCLGLLRGNLFQAVGQGNQQVVQTPIGQWRLRLEPARLQDAQVVRHAERITEKGCFSDPRLAPEDESRPVSAPRSRDEIVDPRALRLRDPGASFEFTPLVTNVGISPRRATVPAFVGSLERR